MSHGDAWNRGVLQEFFGQLDQRVLNAFLKACDELTDILPEQEQQSLQETVRRLHKNWKVAAMCCPCAVQAQIPRHKFLPVGSDLSQRFSSPRTSRQTPPSTSST